MSNLRARATAVIAAGFICFGPVAWAAQNAGATGVQELLLAQYPPAVATPNGTDLVAPGTVVVLQKDDLLTRQVLDPRLRANGQPVATIATSNIYVNGAIKPSGLSGFLGKMIVSGPAGDDQTGNHKSVAGEKFWVIKIQTESDGAVFTLLSDPVNGQRYHAVLKFPFDKGITPEPDLFLAKVAEVLRSDAAAPAVAANVTAPPAPTQSKTISPGQTKDQVGDMLGAPTRVIKMGTKEIDFYPDMKVTFVNNKVTNIE